MVLTDTINLLKNKYKDKIENLKISDVRLGIYLSAIELSDNSYGVASTISNKQHHCIKKNRRFGDFSPSKIKGQRVLDLFNSSENCNIKDTLKMASLNAVSSQILSNQNYTIIEDTDPIELVDLKSKKNITIVGAFQSYIQKISETNNDLKILELNEKALPDEYKKLYVPANKYKTIFPYSDIVIITGLTLLNNTIDGLLSAIKPQTQVIVTGPSSSVIPDILFEQNVNIIGATRITNPELLFNIVSEAGTGYHLFRYCAQKICIINE